mmetsp:Transcript_45512/g.131842  ORF Transcript_45512/g.131842 Transcript_45512/m.131842 type:complete len:262 (-) Transcript_45512:822-1607(-)
MSSSASFLAASSGFGFSNAPRLMDTRDLLPPAFAPGMSLSFTDSLALGDIGTTLTPLPSASSPAGALDVCSGADGPEELAPAADRAGGAKTAGFCAAEVGSAGVLASAEAAGACVCAGAAAAAPSAPPVVVGALLAVALESAQRSGRLPETCSSKGPARARAPWKAVVAAPNAVVAVLLAAPRAVVAVVPTRSTASRAASLTAPTAPFWRMSCTVSCHSCLSPSRRVPLLPTSPESAALLAAAERLSAATPSLPACWAVSG